MIHSWPVCAYSLLRRLLLLQLTREPHLEPDSSMPEYVDIYLKELSSDRAGTRHGDMMRGIGQGLGIEAKPIQSMTADEMRSICIRLAQSIEGLAPDGDASDKDKALAASRAGAWGFWPMGWERNLRQAQEAMAEDKSASA